MDNNLKMNPNMVFVHMGDMMAVFTGDNLFALKSENISDSHFHIDFEFQYVAQGELSLMLNENRQIKLYAQDCALIFPNVSHSAFGIPPFSRFSFNLTLCRTERDDGGCGFSEFEHYIKLLGRIGDVAVLHDNRITQCIEDILELDGQAPCLHRARLALGTLLSRLGVLLENSLKALDVSAPESDSISDESAKRKWITESFVAMYYNDREPLKLLSSMLNLSPRQTARCVSALTGRTIGQLIQKQRMEAAKSLILKTQLDCTEIACRVGYDSYPGFFSAFRRFYGMSPSEFKRAQSKTV